MKLYNTLTRSVEEFAPLLDGRVGIYSCGPTVYDYAHIGNLSSFLRGDLLRRWLEYNRFAVTHVMNLTDVDDKTIRRSRKEGVSLKELTDRYTVAFFADLQKLGIKPASVYPCATEHIPEMVALIQKLLGNGHAYRKDDSIYYRIASFPDYGKLACLDSSGMRVGASGVDADEYPKDNVRDFVLWKAHKPDEDGQVFWDTAIGRGRPGWHIECSAMSMKYLGPTFDLHTGGVDLIFPHHQNEIAQSEGATGQRFVNYWVHFEHLLFGSGKMSKSAGTVRHLADIAPTPLGAAAFRYLVLSSHYRTKLNFTQQGLDAARSTIVRLAKLWAELLATQREGENQVEELADEARAHYINALDNDLNTPQALAAVFELVNAAEKMLGSGELSRRSAVTILEFLYDVDQLFGVLKAAATRPQQKTPCELTADQQELVAARDKARAAKDWQEADRIRGELLLQGIRLTDTPTETKWEKTN